MNPFELMQKFRNPQSLAQELKRNKDVMSNDMGKNFVGMLEKGDMNGISNLGQNLSQTMGFAPDNLRQRIPEPMRRMIGIN